MTRIRLAEFESQEGMNAPEMRGDDLQRLVNLRQNDVERQIMEFATREKKTKHEVHETMAHYRQALGREQNRLQQLKQHILETNELVAGEIRMALGEGIDPLLLAFASEPALVISIITRREFHFRLRNCEEFEASVKRSRGQYMYEGKKTERLSRYAPALARPCHIHAGRERDFLQLLLSAAAAAGVQTTGP